jgi:hypothetical protein
MGSEAGWRSGRGNYCGMMLVNGIADSLGYVTGEVLILGRCGR